MIPLQDMIVSTQTTIEMVKILWGKELHVLCFWGRIQWCMVTQSMVHTDPWLQFVFCSTSQKSPLVTVETQQPNFEKEGSDYDLAPSISDRTAHQAVLRVWGCKYFGAVYTVQQPVEHFNWIIHIFIPPYEWLTHSLARTWQEHELNQFDPEERKIYLL